DEARDRRAFAAIDGAVARMNQMLEELVDTSLLEANRIILRKTPLRLQDLLQDVADSMRSEASRLRVRVEPNLPSVDADRARVERVLENLISNAFKYGAADPPVMVSAARHPEGVEVAVTNAGETLTAEEIKNMFSRFYRAPSAHEAKGLGLGL